jgi:hypothetical protein
MSLSNLTFFLGVLKIISKIRKIGYAKERHFRDASKYTRWREEFASQGNSQWGG